MGSPWPIGLERRDRAPPAHGISLLLLAVLALVFVLQQQSATWSDGRFLVAMVENGRWIDRHALYLPIAQVAAWIGGWFSFGPREALLGLSAVSVALAVALFHQAARASGLSPSSALLGSLLLATTSSAWFYATCVEVHGPQLAVASATVLWAIASRHGSAARSALPAILLFLLLAGTHVSGVLWFPALAIAVARDRDGWRRPRRLALAAFLFVAIAGAWLWIAENETRSGELVRFVVDTTLSRSPRPSFVWREMIVPAGSLFFLAGIVLARSLWTRPAVLGERLPLATIVLFFSFVPVAATLGIDERGAYFLSLIPPLALVACHALERLGRLRIPAALALVGGQLAWSLEEVRKWEHGYPGHEWVPALIAETRGRGTLITGDPEEAAAVWYHSELRVVCPIARAVDERSLKLRMFRTLDRAVRAGEPLAIATSVFEIQGTGIREVVERLIESHGRPVPGARSEYSLLNPPGLPAEPE